MSVRLSTNKCILFLLVLCVVGAGIAYGMYALKQSHTWNQVRQDLENIHKALGSYEHRNGSLPELALYPSDPLSGEDSIRFALSRYMFDPGAFVSPGGHGDIRRTGLTYIWNTELNGGRLSAFDPPVWVLMDIQAVDPNVHPAHSWGYTVLYSDGTVEKAEESPFDVSQYQ